MKTLAFIVNLIGLFSVIIASLLKGNKMAKTLILLWIGNFLVSMGYLLSGTGVAGAASGILACIQITVNYVFELKHRSLPKWLVAVYMISFAAVNIVLEGIAFSTALAILACFCFVLSILQKNGKNYRRCGIANTFIWSIYDIVTHSYNALITHSVLFVINIIGVFIHDLKKEDQVK